MIAIAENAEQQTGIDFATIYDGILDGTHYEIGNGWTLVEITPDREVYGDDSEFWIGYHTDGTTFTGSRIQVKCSIEDLSHGH